ncbi:MAG TPA: hypothetical protein VGQ36_08010 [Thermoanaerobaculia bacterium]|nr:hypothetical protein [Thermoanaerobaculia bacterium]
MTEHNSIEDNITSGDELLETHEPVTRDIFARVVAILTFILASGNIATSYFHARQVNRLRATALFHEAKDDMAGTKGGVYIMSGMPATKVERAKLEEARRKIEEAHTLNPHDPWGPTLMGVYYAKLRNHQQAKQWLAKAPDFARAHTAMANLFREEGKWAEAAKEYELARTLDPTLSVPYFGLAICLHHSGKLRGAIQMLEKCVDADPTSTPCYLEMGNMYVRLKNDTNALTCYERCLEIDAESRPCYQNAITVSRRLGNRQEAETLYRRAQVHGIALEPLSPP